MKILQAKKCSTRSINGRLNIEVNQMPNLKGLEEIITYPIQWSYATGAHIAHSCQFFFFFKVSLLGSGSIKRGQPIRKRHPFLLTQWISGPISDLLSETNILWPLKSMLLKTQKNDYDVLNEKRQYNNYSTAKIITKKT